MSENKLENIEPKIIKTQDENGEVYNFELIDVVEFKGQEYGLLVHVNEDGEEVKENCGCGCEKPKTACDCEECDDDEEEVVIMRLNKEDDNYIFETIEDDNEFNELIAYIESEEDEDDEEE